MKVELFSICVTDFWKFQVMNTYTPWRTFSIFISSTFSDMQAENLPKVQKYRQWNKMDY